MEPWIIRFIKWIIDFGWFSWNIIKVQYFISSISHDHLFIFFVVFLCIASQGFQYHWSSPYILFPWSKKVALAVRLCGYGNKWYLSQTRGSNHVRGMFALEMYIFPRWSNGVTARLRCGARRNGSVKPCVGTRPSRFQRRVMPDRFRMLFVFKSEPGPGIHSPLLSPQCERQAGHWGRPSVTAQLELDTLNLPQPTGEL